LEFIDVFKIGHKPMRAVFLRFWHSPTAMTWMGHLAKTLQVVVVMPLAFAYLGTEEAIVWLIFLTLISLQVLADMGFTPTFTRALSMAFAGARDLKGAAHGQEHNRKLSANTGLVCDIVGTMRSVFMRLSVFATLILAILGTAVLVGPIEKTGNVSWAWIAWCVVLVSSTITFYGNSYIAYLQAAQRIPQIHRLRTVTVLAATVSVLIALELEAGLLGLVLAQQSWQVVLVLWYRRSAKADGMYLGVLPDSKRNKEVFDYVWSASWKTGLGVLLGYSVIQASGLIYVQFAPAEEAAIYLLLLRLMQSISMFSQAPFYSKLPALSRLWVSGKTEALRNLSARGMRISYWVYGAGVIFVGVTFPVLFDVLETNISFPDPILWALFGLGGLAERFGAMHINIYSLTNHIIMPIANGIAGILFIVTSIVLVQHIGTYGFAVGLIVANLGFYSWYSARHSYRVLETNFFQFDRPLLFIPFGIMCLYLGVVCY